MLNNSSAALHVCDIGTVVTFTEYVYADGLLFVRFALLSARLGKLIFKRRNLVIDETRVRGFISSKIILQSADKLTSLYHSVVC